MADRQDRPPTWVTTVGFGVLTLNSGLAIYRARDDPASVVFVASSYLILLLLFRCLREDERMRRGSPAAGERARRAVWPLTTLLTLALGVVNTDMALAIHKAGSDPVDNNVHGVVGYGQHQDRSLGAADAAH